jgi:predicted ATPase
LLQLLGDAYADALSTHRSLIREAIRAGDGHELGTEGDSFFIVFDSARSAVETCLRAQRALQSQRWPQDSELRVRMGVHTGEPLRHEDGYVGLDVHRAARIASAAHGGQIVLSDSTRRLVEGALPVGATLLPLGRHRLKDLASAEQLCQLAAPGLLADFPPVRSLGATTSLPRFATALIGRSEEVRRIRRLVSGESSRLVTLAGPGGSGKTRLAVAVAETVAAADGREVFFAALETVTTAAEGWRVVAEAVGASAGPEPVTAALAALRDSAALVVLDNLEQITDADELVRRLADGCPQVSVLVTSRRPLHQRGEHTVEVGSLGTADAARLFARQATLVRRGFRVDGTNDADVAAVCQRLDGLPLGIELAAARVRLLSPAALLTRLDLSLGAIGSDRPERQRTLRSAVAWSYDLLSEDARAVFELAGVFEGGCDLEGFAAVTGLDAAAALAQAESLADASLLTFADGPDGEPRLTLLRTVRDFAVERLELSGDAQAVRRRHAEYYADMVEAGSALLNGPGQTGWIERLRIEHANTSAALRWCLDDSSEGPASQSRLSLGLRIANGLIWFWYRTGAAHEGRQLLDQLRDKRIGPDAPELVLAVQGLAVLLLQVGESEQALPLLSQALATWRQLDNRPRIARALNSLGVAHRDQGETELARGHFNESIEISTAIGDTPRLAATLSNLAQVAIDEQRPAEAEALLRTALAIDRAAGDQWAVAIGETNLTAALLDLGRLDEAERLLASVAQVVHDIRDLESTADVLERGAVLRSAQGRAADAALLAGVAANVRREAHIPTSVVDARRFEALLAPARAVVGESDWTEKLAATSAVTTEQALRSLTGESPPA